MLLFILSTEFDKKNNAVADRLLFIVQFHDIILSNTFFDDSTLFFEILFYLSFHNARKLYII